MSIKTPEQIASEVFAAHDLESVRESSTREVFQMIAEAIAADRAQRAESLPEETRSDATPGESGVIE